MVYATILICEIGFWALLGLGLVCRYLLRRRTVGAVLLVMVPLVDLVLLSVTVIDIRDGATPQLAHGLAAVYIGVTVVWGRPMIGWAEGRFAHRFAGGKRQPSPPTVGAAHARHERVQWLRHLLAFAIGGTLLGGGALVIGDWDRASGLLAILPKWAVVLGVDFLWSFSYSVLPRRGAGRHPQPPTVTHPQQPRNSD